MKVLEIIGWIVLLKFCFDAIIGMHYLVKYAKKEVKEQNYSDEIKKYEDKKLNVFDISNIGPCDGIELVKKKFTCVDEVYFYDAAFVSLHGADIDPVSRCDKLIFIAFKERKSSYLFDSVLIDERGPCVIFEDGESKYSISYRRLKTFVSKIKNEKGVYVDGIAFEIKKY